MWLLMAVRPILTPLTTGIIRECSTRADISVSAATGQASVSATSVSSTSRSSGGLPSGQCTLLFRGGKSLCPKWRTPYETAVLRTTFMRASLTLTRPPFSVSWRDRRFPVRLSFPGETSLCDGVLVVVLDHHILFVLVYLSRGGMDICHRSHKEQP